MFSKSEENYIKAIYHLSLAFENGVSTNAIANSIKTKASSVTDMVKKLSEKKLLIYKKYQGVTLTELGRKTAANIIRKHRLWEVFLVDKLKFSWDEVHEIAEELEHIKSKKLINELDAFLGFPKRDPHGDVIPDKNGNIDQENSETLSNLNEGDMGVVIGVRDSSSLFLKYLDGSSIKLGSTIKVNLKEAFDNSMLVEIDNEIRSLSIQITKNLFVKEIK
jgi:DtxR family Mn-dependent transcriptional regulator